jgi:multiple sugar transport system permease protein
MAANSVTPPANLDPKQERQTTLQFRERRLAWMLISPTAFIVFSLVLFPAFFSIWISFHDVGLDNLNNVFAAEFVGFENYEAVFNDFRFMYQGPLQWGAFITSIVYSFASTILAILLGLAAAIILNQRFFGRGLVRGLFLFPYIAPVVSVAFVWKWILLPGPEGVVNDILMTLGVIDLPQQYLSERGLALWLVVAFQGWRYFPFAMLMILARLQAIDSTLYEAVEVDGGGTWAKFWYVTLPALRYILAAIFLLRLLWTFNKFDDIWLLTGGGFGTNVLPVLTYQYSFQGSQDFGKGAAAAMILLVILLIIIFFYVVFVFRRMQED